jgi:hypothetical protein
MDPIRCESPTGDEGQLQKSVFEKSGIPTQAKRRLGWGILICGSGEKSGFAAQEFGIELLLHSSSETP